MIRVALASDHAGFRYRKIIEQHLKALKYSVRDFGAGSTEPVDYPDVIRPAAESVASGETDYGIVFGGSGNGEAIVANKVKGIRCCVCWNETSAKLAKEHNNANMISIGQRMVDEEEMTAIVDTWLQSEFEGGRHRSRIDKIE